MRENFVTSVLVEAQNQREKERIMLKEFGDFIKRGNVLDLAVAVIIGGAFGAIVTSLVNDIIMPIIGVILGGVDFSGLAIQIGEASIMYGNFIQAIINFLIIAWVIFMIVQYAKRFEKEEPAAPPAPPAEVVLLTEIRDLLQDGR
jgi:large conductance mechanosensitive channel